jgi:hypothetical protein
VAYLRREEDEEKLLDFITKSFVFPEDGLLEEEAMASTVDSPPEVEEEPLVAKVRTNTRGMRCNQPIIEEGCMKTITRFYRPEKDP